MSIVSGYKKAKKYLKTTSGYSLISQWVSSHTVEMDDGSTLETKITDMDTEINQKAESNSPTLIGSPQAPTAPAGSNTTQIATTAFVQNAVKDTITDVKSGDACILASRSGNAVTVTHQDAAGTDTTSTASPSIGGSFTAVDSIAKDAKGHITSVNTKTVNLPTFQAENITAESVGALPTTGGTLTGNLRIKNDTNYGMKINFGDNDYVHLHEYEDDKLEIKGSTIKLATNNLYQNGERINLTDLKKSVSDGKSAVASAITDMGVSTSSDAAFSTMSNNIRNISKDATASASDIVSGKTAYADGRKVTGNIICARATGAKQFGAGFPVASSGYPYFCLWYLDHVSYNQFGLHYTINTYNWGSVSPGDNDQAIINVTGNGGNINVLRSNWSFDASKFNRMVVSLHGKSTYVGGSLEFRGCVGVCANGARSSTGAEGREYALSYGAYEFTSTSSTWHSNIVVDLSWINQEVQFHMSTVHAGEVYVNSIGFIPN